METGTLHTGCKIVSADIKAERPSVTLDDGRKFVGDVLLGADGLHVSYLTFNMNKLQVSSSH